MVGLSVPGGRGALKKGDGSRISLKSDAHIIN